MQNYQEEFEKASIDQKENIVDADHRVALRSEKQRNNPENNSKLNELEKVIEGSPDDQLVEINDSC